MRSILLASLAIGLGCGPETSPDFSGVYSVTWAGSWCVADRPGEPSSSAVYVLKDDLVIDEDGTGTFLLELPMPPCPIVGSIEGDQIRLTADDCVIEIETSESEDYSVEYDEIVGSGRWEDDGLVLRVEMRHRYLSFPPYGSPDWWDYSSSCSASYELEPVDQPGS